MASTVVRYERVVNKEKNTEVYDVYIDDVWIGSRGKLEFCFTEADWFIKRGKQLRKGRIIYRGE